MKLFLSRLVRPSLLQAVAEVLGLACLALAAFMVARPLGIAAVGISLLLVGNVRLR